MAYQPISLRDFDYREEIGNPLQRYAEEAQRRREAAVRALLEREQFTESKRAAGVDEKHRERNIKNSEFWVNRERENAAEEKRIKAEDRTMKLADRRRKLIDEAEALAGTGDVEGARRLYADAGATEVAPKRYTANEIQIGAGGERSPVTGVTESAGAMPTTGPRKYRDESGREYTSDPEGLRARREATASAALEKYAPAFKPDGKDEEIDRLKSDAWKQVRTGAIDPETAIREVNDQAQAIRNNRASVRSAGLRAAATGQKPTEVQNKNAFYASEVDQALEVINNMPPLSPEKLAQYQRDRGKFQSSEKFSKAFFGAGAVPVGLGRWAGAIPKSPTESLTPDEQAVVNAWDVINEAKARTKSGAVIGEEEEEAERRRAVPGAGDSPELRKIKTKNAVRLRENLYGLSGPAAGLVRRGERPDAPSAPAPPPPPRMNPIRKAAVDKDDESFIRGGRR